MFWLALGILVFGATFFYLFASGELQSWAVVSGDKETEKIQPELAKLMEMHASIETMPNEAHQFT